MRQFAFFGFLMLLLFSSAVYAGVYSTDKSAAAIAKQPKTMDAAIAEIKQMLDSGQSRLDVAKRVTQIADIQVYNANTAERMKVSSSSWKFWKKNPYQEKFEKWRKGSGAEAQTKDISKWVWDSRFGQCAENSGLIYHILTEAGAKNVRLITQPKHRFVIWFDDDEAAHDSESSYGEGTIIPDGWQGKVLTGKDAYKDNYCGAKSLQLQDVSHVYDQSAQAKCGYLGAPCCKTIAECRNSPQLICKSYGKCGPCGKLNQDCCKDQKCDSGLYCNDGTCGAEKKAEAPPEDETHLQRCARTAGTDTGDFCYYQYVMATCEGSYCDQITDGSSWKWKCENHASMCG